jgi:hypothetical protein
MITTVLLLFVYGLFGLLILGVIGSIVDAGTRIIGIQTVGVIGTIIFLTILAFNHLL